MQFEVGKIYYIPNGDSIKLECLAVVAGYPVMREVGCHSYKPFVSSVNLSEWKEYKEPITVEGWVVIKSNGAAFFASEKRIAQCYVDHDERATIVHVKGTEGIEP